MCVYSYCTMCGDIFIICYIRLVLIYLKDGTNVDAVVVTPTGLPD